MTSMILDVQGPVVMLMMMTFVAWDYWHRRYGWKMTNLPHRQKYDDQYLRQIRQVSIDELPAEVKAAYQALYKILKP